MSSITIKGTNTIVHVVSYLWGSMITKGFSLTYKVISITVYKLSYIWVTNITRVVVNILPNIPCTWRGGMSTCWDDLRIPMSSSYTVFLLGVWKLIHCLGHSSLHMKIAHTQIFYLFYAFSVVASPLSESLQCSPETRPLKFLHLMWKCLSCQNQLWHSYRKSSHMNFLSFVCLLCGDFYTVGVTSILTCK